MSQASELDLAFLAVPQASPQRGTESPFVPREGAFDLPSLAVETIGESSFHLQPVAGSGPFSAVAFASRNDGSSDAQRFPAPAMMVFRVVGGISQQAVQRESMMGGLDRGSELGRIVARSPDDIGREEQVCRVMTDDRELGKVGPAMPFPSPPDVVTADVTGFQARRVDRPGAVYCGRTGSEMTDGVKEGVGAIFFRSLSWA